MGGRSNIEQVFFLSIFPVSVILIGYRHLRAIEPHTKIHLIKEALLSCIIGHCTRKRKTDNSNWKKFRLQNQMKYKKECGSNLNFLLYFISVSFITYYSGWGNMSACWVCTNPSCNKGCISFFTFFRFIRVITCVF